MPALEYREDPFPDSLADPGGLVDNNQQVRAVDALKCRRIIVARRKTDREVLFAEAPFFRDQLAAQVVTYALGLFDRYVNLLPQNPSNLAIRWSRCQNYRRAVSL